MTVRKASGPLTECHTVAPMVIGPDDNLKVIQDQQDHANVGTTDNIRGHPLAEKERDAALRPGSLPAARRELRREPRMASLTHTVGRNGPGAAIWAGDGAPPARPDPGARAAPRRWAEGIATIQPPGGPMRRSRAAGRARPRPRCPAGTGGGCGEPWGSPFDRRYNRPLLTRCQSGLTRQFTRHRTLGQTAKRLISPWSGVQIAEPHSGGLPDCSTARRSCERSGDLRGPRSTVSGDRLG